MTNLSIEELKKRAELLKIARQLLNKDYINRRAQQHQLWIANSETSWKATRSLLPYPLGTLYPTEEEVVAKALELYNSEKQLQDRSPPTIDASVSVKPATVDTPIIDPIIESLQPETVTLEVPAVIEPEPIEETIESESTEEVAIEPSQETPGKHSLLRNVLSGWLQKNKDKET